MIKFFRKIRQRLLTENKFSKYLLYAVGEIVLVVIGILIALSINNWNEYEIDENKETKILISLQNELIENHTLLEKIIERHLQNANLTKELSQKIKPSASEIPSIKFNRMMAAIITPIKYEPSLGVMDGIISSGDISLITDFELKYKIPSLIRHIEYYNYWAEITYDKHIQSDYPFIKKRYPIKNITYGVEVKMAGMSSFSSDQKSLLTSFEFESIVDLRYVNAMNLHLIAKEIQLIQDQLLILIESNLKD